MKFCAFLLFLAAASSIDAFAPAISSSRHTISSTTTSLNVIKDGNESAVQRVKRVIKEKLERVIKGKRRFDSIVKSNFKGAIDNNHLEETVVTVLADKGFTSANTLLATSLCADELARNLEDDFVEVYGKNFNLGGLSGFPFAGNTGFGAMAAHIPDDGCCLIVYGPHVGISADGSVGKVERDGIALIDTCCGSAVAALGYLKGITEGGAEIDIDLQKFEDFQQGAVRELILPHGKRLMDSKDQMVELPYALYDSQDLLMRSIVNAGASGTKSGGLAILGGIQINTGPNTPDYFHPLRFDLMNNKGAVVEDMLPLLTK